MQGSSTSITVQNSIFLRKPILWGSIIIQCKNDIQPEK